MQSINVLNAPICSCSSWKDGTCAGDGIRRQTRDCTPLANGSPCDDESRTHADSTCDEATGCEAWNGNQSSCLSADCNWCASTNKCQSTICGGTTCTPACGTGYVCSNGTCVPNGGTTTCTECKGWGTCTPEGCTASIMEKYKWLIVSGAGVVVLLAVAMSMKK
jgi:hypothetical protein